MAHAQNARAALRALAPSDIASRRRTTRSRLCGNRGPTYVHANSGASPRVRTVRSRARRRGGSNAKSVTLRKLARHNPAPVPTYIMSDTLSLRRAPPGASAREATELGLPNRLRHCGSPAGSSAGCPDLARRLSGPALERMRERAHLMKTEQPRDLGYVQPAVIKVANRQVAPQLLKYFGKVQPFVREPSCKRPLAHSQTAGNVFHARLSMRKHRRDRVLNSGTQLAHVASSIG